MDKRGTGTLKAKRQPKTGSADDFPVSGHTACMLAGDLNARLLDTARKAEQEGVLPKLDGAVRERLEQHLREQAEFKIRWEILGAHDRAREAAVTGVQQILRAGALLLGAQAGVPPSQFESFVARCGLDPQTAKAYVRLAAKYSKLADECRRRRRARLFPADAAPVLKSLRQGKNLTTIVTLEDLRAIFDLAGT